MSSIWLIHFCHSIIILLLTIFSLDISSANLNEVNLALHKRTYGSSSANNYPSSVVVDGKKDICWGALDENYPFWSVRLQDVYKIKSVKIYFDEYYTYEFWLLSVYIHMLDGSGKIICQNDINFVQDFLLVSCQGAIGEIVTVQLEKKGVLNLCEVEVFGEKHFQPTSGDIISGHYCRYNKKASRVINSFSTRSSIECAVLCTQTHNCDTFHFETNADKKLLCQLKETSPNGFMDKQDYNIC